MLKKKLLSTSHARIGLRSVGGADFGSDFGDGFWSKVTDFVDGLC